MWYVRDVLYAVLYVRVSCFVVRGCGVSRRYIDVCYCDMLSVVNVYLDHLKFCVLCINSRRYVCCSECDVVSNECNEPTSCLVQPIGAHCCEVLDGYISANQRFFSTFLSKITKYNRVPLGFDPSVARLLGYDPTPRPTCPVWRE